MYTYEQIENDCNMGVSSNGVVRNGLISLSNSITAGPGIHLRIFPHL